VSFSSGKYGWFAFELAWRLNGHEGRKALSDAPPIAPEYKCDATGAFAGAKVSLDS
jgi:hypothetical protein